MIDVELADDDTFMLYEAEAKVWDVPGHTAGHIAYWFSEKVGLYSAVTPFSRLVVGVFSKAPSPKCMILYRSSRKSRMILGSTAHMNTLWVTLNLPLA